MCVVYPGRVIEVAADGALVETDRRRRRASTLLMPETEVGDWVVVSAGAVIRILEPAEAEEIRSMLDEAARRDAARRGRALPPDPAEA